jgi:hypothetical protein
MMVSYHGSEHYNSVRSSTAKKPPPPSKTPFAKKKSSAAIESEGDETEAILTNGGDHMDIDEEKEDTEVEPPPKPPKKNDPCQCGSGLRYKKCCLVIDKSKQRAQKWKAKHGSVKSDDNPMEGSDDRAEEKMDGNFRVLKI